MARLWRGNSAACCPIIRPSLILRFARSEDQGSLISPWRKSSESAALSLRRQADSGYFRHHGMGCPAREPSSIPASILTSLSRRDAVIAAEDAAQPVAPTDLPPFSSRPRAQVRGSGCPFLGKASPRDSEQRTPRGRAADALRRRRSSFGTVRDEASMRISPRSHCSSARRIRIGERTGFDGSNLAALPNDEHSTMYGTNIRGTYSGSPAELLDKTITDLRNYTMAPNSALSQLKSLIKNTHSRSFE